VAGIEQKIIARGIRRMIGSVSLLDAALIAIALISGLLAMYRGFTREILSIISWVAAAGAVFYFVLNHKSTAEEIARSFAPAPVPVVQVVVGGIIFLIVLIVVHLITSRLSDTILDSRVGMIDRLLGLVFGALRGFVIIVIGYMFYVSFVHDESQQPEWVRNSIARPYIQDTGRTVQDFLLRVIPKDLHPPGGGAQPG
jgi:membrane protein required for colicin V production